MKTTHSFIALFFLPTLLFAADELPKPVLVDVQRIWNEAPHNAFTDLVRFKDRWRS